MNRAIHSEPVTKEEVRRSPRITYRASTEAIVYPVIAGKGKPSRCLGLTQDISSTGCNIVHAVQLFPGQRLEILLDGKTPRPAVVAWCKPLPDKHYAVGCRFTDTK